MLSPKIFMAASVPRFLRQTRLAYLPQQSVIGSRLTKGDGGSNLAFDIIMLPVEQFPRMRSNVGLQQIPNPAPKMGPAFNPGFVLSDAKQVVVPENEPDPETYAKNYFLEKFGIVAQLEDVSISASFDKSAGNYTRRTKT